MQCSFYLPSDGPHELLRNDGFATYDLGNIPPERSELCIIDGYRFSESDRSRWRQKARVVLSIDDLATSPLNADFVLNQNLFANADAYRHLTSAVLLLGPRFALIDPCFCRKDERPITLRETPRVLISFGGSDNGQLASATAEALLGAGWPGPLDLVIPPQQEIDPAALALSDQQDRVRLLEAPEMAPLMASADLFIGGAGSSLFECAAMKLPMILAIIIDNQSQNLATLREKGVTILSEPDPRELANSALSWMASPEGNPLGPLVDGQGPQRVAEILLSKLER